MAEANFEIKSSDNIFCYSMLFQFVVGEDNSCFPSASDCYVAVATMSASKK